MSVKGHQLSKKTAPLKVVRYSHIYLLFCFLILKDSFFETRKNAFHFTSKTSFLLEIFKFRILES